MTARHKPKRAAFGIQDKVRTLRGEGIIKHVFPQGPRGKNAYSVDLRNARFCVIFAEDEIAFTEKAD